MGEGTAEDRVVGQRYPNRQITLPSGRGVCLFSSSCLGSLTAAAGSELAGRRLQGCALRTVLSHRAPRGRRWPCGATPSSMSVFRWFDPVRSVVSPHPRPIATDCPPPEGAGGGRRPGGGGLLRGGPAPPLRARSVVRSTTRRALPSRR